MAMEKRPPPREHDISHKFEPLNSGNLGREGYYNAGVYVVRSKRSGKTYVEKRYAPQDVLNSTAEFEMLLLRELRHPNIVEYVTGFIDLRTHRASIYLEHCDKGNLWDFMAQREKFRRPLGEPWVWNIFMQLVSAVAFIQYGVRDACYESDLPEHWTGVIHRDIKLDNIFLCSQPNSTHFRIVLGDFGQAMREDDDGT
ncbi:MAG: hypothetical protein Q9181_002428 [Wetmoreana brouardii]